MVCSFAVTSCGCDVISTDVYRLIRSYNMQLNRNRGNFLVKKITLNRQCWVDAEAEENFQTATRGAVE